MENLQVRYVIPVRSTRGADLTATKTVRIKLVKAGTGRKLEIVGASGKPVRSKVVVEDERGTQVRLPPVSIRPARQPSRGNAANRVDTRAGRHPRVRKDASTRLRQA